MGHNAFRSARRGIGIAGAAAIAALGVGAGSASAATVNWNCVLAPGAWCHQGAGRQYDINTAERPAPWEMCESLTAPPPNVSTITYSYKCSSGAVYRVGGYSNDTSLAPYPNNNTIMLAWIRNNSSTTNATVYGVAVY